MNANLNTNGDCNDWDRKASFAHIYYNTAYPWAWQSEPEWVATHELGHVFGLGHNDQQSIMNRDVHWIPPLRTHDINDVNALY